jgi:hypothetical protein
VLRIYHPAKRQGRIEAITDLFGMISRRQPEFFLKFIETQRIEDRRSLMPFVAFSESQPRVQSDDESDGCSEDPMVVVLKELKSGNNAKLFKLASSIERITVEKSAHQRSLFLKLLQLLSDLDEVKLTRHQNEVRRICASHFSSAKLMAIVDSVDITPGQILGLSRFVRYCDPDVLAGAAQHYPGLYERFRRSAGDQRRHLVEICYSIEMVTNQSVVSVEGVAEQHKEVIRKMIREIRNYHLRQRAGASVRQ